MLRHFYNNQFKSSYEWCIPKRSSKKGFRAKNLRMSNRSTFPFIVFLSNDFSIFILVFIFYFILSSYPSLILFHYSIANSIDTSLYDVSLLLLSNFSFNSSFDGFHETRTMFCSCFYCSLPWLLFI